MDLGSSNEARYAVENLAPLDGFGIATWGITWPKAVLAHVKSIGGSENLTSPEKAKRQATERKNMIRIYELSLGHNSTTDMTTILDHKTNTIIAEFDDYNMAKYFLNKCFKLILKDVNRDGWLYTLKQQANRKE